MLLKRLICLLLAMTLLPLAALAEADNGADDSESTLSAAANIALNYRPESEEPTHLDVANTTKVSGSFFTTQFGNNTSDIDVRYMLHGYNPVVWADQVDFIADPMVTEEISTSNDAEGNTVYTVKLFNDLTWNDGTPLNAKDYVFSYLMLASDEFYGLGADTGAWKHVVGYDAYSVGETNVLTGVHLVDDYTFSVTVKQEYLPYFYELSYLFNYPYPMSVIAPGCTVKDDGDGAEIVNEDSSVTEPIYTTALLEKTILDPDTGYLSYPYLTAGPYKLVSYDRESGVVEFALNEYYKGNYEGVKPVIDTVTLKPCLPENMIQQLADGEIGLINKAVDKKVIDSGMELVAGGDFSTENYPRIGYGYLAVATEKGPQQFVKVRQAIAYCFDSDTFVTELLGSYGIVDYAYYGLAQWMYLAAAGTLRPEEMTEEQAAVWDAQNLNNLNHYSMDYDKALSLLIEDGWTLNAQGEEFDAEKDDYRYKRLEDGSLMKLSFQFAQCADNDFAQRAVDMLTQAFAYVHAELVVHVVPFTELLADYYRDDGERLYDLNFMATNFVSTFDPYMTYTPGPDFEGEMNTSGFYDQELFELAKDMHDTEPHAMLEYLTKWVAFQERWNEILPTIPIYTNMYFDFHVSALRNYYPNAECNWPVALIYAFLADDWEDPTVNTEDVEEADGDTVIME